MLLAMKGELTDIICHFYCATSICWNVSHHGKPTFKVHSSLLEICRTSPPQFITVSGFSGECIQG